MALAILLGVEQLHVTATSLLRGAGLRYTPSRRELVELLAECGQPVTLPQILGKRPDLAQSTAYRLLSELTLAGIVRRIVTSDDHSHFELAEDLTGHHHHHLVCSQCGVVADFAVPSGLEELIESVTPTIEKANGFVVDSHRLDLVGRCRACAAERAVE